MGASSVLFGIDARQVEAELGIPAMNLGLHAGMSLDRILSVGRDLLRRNDVLVLQLEHTYYRCGQNNLTSWQLRNAIAWDHAYFERLPRSARIMAAFKAGDFGLAPEILAAKLGAAVVPAAFVNRLNALASPRTIIARYRSGNLRTTGFLYSAYNLDSRGDLLNNDAAEYQGPGVSANNPEAICPETLDVLSLFVKQMKARGVRVLFAHTPYLVEGVPASGWPQSESRFMADIASIGGGLLDRREELFMPRSDFFNTDLHLNNRGRYKRTAIIIANLRRLGVSSPGIRVNPVSQGAETGLGKDPRVARGVQRRRDTRPINQYAAPIQTIE